MKYLHLTSESCIPTHFRPPTEVIIPNLTVRRSTIARVPKKSICENDLSRKESGTINSQQRLNSLSKGDAALMVERTPSLIPNV